MRFLIKVKIPVETGNALIRAGKMGETMQSILADLKPEATYFVDESGHRVFYCVADIATPSDLPSVVEPFWLVLKAEVETFAAMTPEDLNQAMSKLAHTAKKYM